MDGIGPTVRHAVRSLLRYKAVSVLAVACMGLGIGTCVTLFTAVNPWLYRPLPYPAAERLVSVRETLPDGGSQWSSRTLLSGPDYLDWLARARSFDGMAAFERTEYNLAAEGEPERVSAVRVTASLLPTLGVAPISGRLFDASEDRPGSAVALVSHSLWKRRLGEDPAIVGRALRLDGRLYTVVGVMPERFNFPEYADVWTPLGLEAGEERGQRRLDVVARLREDTPLAQAQLEGAAIAAQIAREHPDSHAGRSAVVWPYLQSFTPPGVVIGMYLVLAAGLFVQLIACANVANLLLVKATGQRHDTAIRFSLGARRSHILRQSLVETLLVCAAGGALGLALGAFGAARVVDGSPMPPPTWARYDVDWRVVAFTIALTAASAVAVSLVPVLGSRNLAAELKDSGRTSTGGARGRLGRLLTVGELAAALVLLISASLMVQSFHQRYASDAGVATEGVLTARLALAGDAYAEPEARAAFADELVRRLVARSEVAEAGVASAMPFQDPSAGGWQSRGVEIEGQPIEPGKPAPRAVYFAVSPGYPAAAGLRLRAGRFLEAEDDEQRREVALVSASLARRGWGDADPLGRRVRLDDGPWLRVVGVVENVRDAGDAILVGGKPGDQVYVPLRADTPANLVLAVRTRSEPGGFAAALRSSVRSLDPALPLHSVHTLAEVRARSAWVAQMWGGLLSQVAGLALLLAVLGVYGVVSYSVSQRTHEIGIRMAVGAGRGRVVGMVLGDGLRLALWAAGLGLLAAAVFTRSMARLLYGVGALDPPTLLGCASALVLVALAASAAPAWRGTRVDPVVALRSE
jgi:putative ABC transport system permease protein